MKKLKEKLKKITLKQWHIVLIIIGIIFISLGAFHSNMWFDEAYSIGMARHTFTEIWTIGGHDVHPVLYYWLLHIINLITSGSIVAYRIFSVIPISIMIILGYTHIRKDFGKKTGFIFSFLCAFLPEMAVYALEIRMYSWALLTVTILAIYAYRLAKEDNIKNWIIFGISSLASIYLHYYGLMAAGIINIVLLVHLIKNKRKKGIIFIISFGLIQAIAYLPWLIYLATQLNQVSGGFWIGFTFPNTLMELTSSQFAGQIKSGDYRDLLVPFIFAFELYAYIIYKTYKLSKEKNDLKPFKLTVGIYFAVVLAALIMTLILGTLILYYRYLFILIGLYIFAISFILAKEKNKIEIISILSVIFVLGIYYNIDMIRDNYSSSNLEPLNYIDEHLEKNDTIVYTEFTTGSVVANHCLENKKFFYNEENWGVEEAYKAFEPNYETVVTKDFMEECSDRIWVIDNAYGNSANDLYGNNEEYKIVSEETFFTEYHDYSWKITLVERVN